MPFVLALDQGTTSSRAILFDHDGARARRSRRRSSARSFRSPAGSSTTPREIWATQSGVDARGARQGAASARATSRRSASPTSARRRWCGSARPAGRSPTRSSGRTGARRRCATSCAPRDTRRSFAAQDRPRARRLLLRAPSSRWLLDNVPGARARASAGELAFGTIDTWLIWKLTGGARALHRRDATPPARCSSTSTPAMGRRAPAPARRAARGAAASRGLVGRVRRDAASAACGVPIAGIAGDQQAALFGQACLDAGTGEEHLRHRLLPAAEHRRDRRSRSRNNLADDGRVEARRAPRLRARRQRVHRRRGRAMAARRAADHPACAGEIEALARSRAGQRRRLSRAGVRRAGRAALGRVRARRDLRPDARHHRARTSRARRSKRSRSPERRRARRHAERTPASR